jgi:hypothetical protein
LKHRASADFWSCYARLPQEVRELADKAFAFLRQDERHPSLHLKKVGRFWSVRVGSRYRALGVESGETLIWFWIGTHAEYDDLVR